MYNSWYINDPSSMYTTKPSNQGGDKAKRTENPTNGNVTLWHQNILNVPFCSFIISLPSKIKLFDVEVHVCSEGRVILTKKSYV